MFNYILKRFTKIVLRIVLLIIFLGISLLAIIYFNYKNSTEYINPNIVFKKVMEDKSVIYFNEKNRSFLKKNNIWAIRLDENGNVVESFNKPSEVKTKFEITDIVRFTRYYLNDYPVFTYVLESGIIVFAYPKNSLDKFPVNFYNFGTIILIMKIAILLFILFLLGVYILYRIDVKNIYKRLNPIQKSIENLFEKNYEDLEESGDFKELSIAINDANKNYLNLQSSMSKWIRGISHDLRTPLAKITWDLNGIKTKENKQKIEKMMENVIRISHLIEDLNLTMSLENLKKDRFCKKDPVLVIRKIIVDKSNEFPEREILFNNESRKLELEMDENLFKRMIENILNNSLNYTKGSITVTTKDFDGKFLIKISDIGNGISNEVIKRIKSGDINEVRTHGLGLFISKQISELHGGNFYIKNTKTGSEISFLFYLN